MSQDTLRVTKGTSIEMSYTSIQQRNSETGVYSNLTSPDTITFTMTMPNGTSTSISGDQIGSTNGFYAKRKMTSTGDHEWAVRIVEGTDELVDGPFRVIVTST